MSHPQALRGWRSQTGSDSNLPRLQEEDRAQGELATAAASQPLPVPLRSPSRVISTRAHTAGLALLPPRLQEALTSWERLSSELLGWGGGFRTRWGCTWQRGSQGGRQGEGACGQQQVLGITLPSTPSRTGWKGSLAVSR